MNRLGIITGMKVEADILSAAAQTQPERSRPLFVAVGGNAREAEAAAREFANAGVAGLISFGIAGGLDPVLRTGDIVIAEAVVLPNGESVRTCAVRRASLAASIGSARRVIEGPVAGTDFAVSKVLDKAALRNQSDAIAVDLESHGVARAALEFEVPFTVIRAIADPAERAIPAAALAGLASDGSRRPFAVLGELLKHPLQLPALIRIARDSNEALRSLAAVASDILQNPVG